MFDQIDIGTLRNGGGLKWTLYPGAIGAFVAEMDFGVAPPITRALHEAVDAGGFGYLPGALSDRMSQACADWGEQRYGWKVDPADVRPVVDVIESIKLAIDLFSRPGSPVIVPTPAYMPFITVPPALGREVIQVPLRPDEHGWTFDLDALDAAFRRGGHLLVLCNPHNPTGRVLRREELAGITEVVDRHGGRVFADEIHAPLIYPGHTHVPYASTSDTAAGHTFTATSASKAWNLPGLKCAQIVLSNDADREVWRQKGFYAERGASNLGVVASTAAYAEGGPWLTEVLAYLDQCRDLLGDLVTELLPDVHHHKPEGTYLGLLDCRDLSLDGSPAEFFRERAGVAMTDGAACGDAGRGWVRITFALPRPILRQAIGQMASALKSR